MINIITASQFMDMNYSINDVPKDNGTRFRDQQVLLVESLPALKQRWT